MLSRLLLTDASGRVLQSIENAAFSETAFQQAATLGDALSLVPCTRLDEPGSVTLRYATEGLLPLSRRLPEMDDAVFYAFVERLVHVLLGVHLAKGFSISAVVTNFECIYCDSSNVPRLLYTFQEPSENSSPQQRHVLTQLRQLAHVRTPQTAELWECIDDPFCDLFVLNTFFSLRAAKPSGGSVTVMPRQAPFRGNQPARPEKPEDSGIINAVRGSISMVSSQSSSMPPRPAPVPVFGMDQPTQDEPAVPGERDFVRGGALKPPSAPAFGIDQPTQDAPASNSLRHPAAEASLAVGIDQETADEAIPYEPRPEPRVLPRIDPAPVKTPPDGSAPIGPAPAPSAHKIPEGVSPHAWQAYLDQKAAFWRTLGLLTAGLAGTVLLGLVIGAFTGFLGVLLYLMLVLLSGAVLMSRGYLDALRPYHKPKPVQPEPQAPDIEAVFSVRIKLRSTNLTSPVEITVRQQNQLIGSDKRYCVASLPFKGVSRRHFRIISTKVAGHTDYAIRDEGSKNGTELNGQFLEPGKEYPLHVGDRITLAHRYVFVVCSDAY